MTYDAASFHRSSQARPVPGGSRHWMDEAWTTPRPTPPASVTGDPVVVDCDTCRARGAGCGDCVVTVLLGGPPQGVTLNAEERRALDVLAAAGMIPPLRLVDSIEVRFDETQGELSNDAEL